MLKLCGFVCFAGLVWAFDKQAYGEMWINLSGCPSPESDVPAELRVANGSQKFVNFTSTIQNQLLLVSLLEHLCHMYTHNPVHSRCLFRS